MGADLLRRAADLLRALSNGATDGPWKVGHEVDGVMAERATTVRAAGKRVVTVGQTRSHHHGSEAEVNVAYIAAMHPRVGVAVAEWLESEAPNADYREGAQRQMNATRLRDEPFPCYYDKSTEHAIAIARLIVGGEQ